MASISSTSKPTPNNRIYQEELDWNKPLCDCGWEAVIRIARTEANYGRKFFGCPKYKVMILFRKYFVNA